VELLWKSIVAGKIWFGWFPAVSSSGFPAAGQVGRCIENRGESRRFE